MWIGYAIHHSLRCCYGFSKCNLDRANFKVYCFRGFLFSVVMEISLTTLNKGGTIILFRGEGLGNFVLQEFFFVTKSFV